MRAFAIALLSLVALAFIAIAPILAAVALTRIARLRAELDRLDRRVDALARAASPARPAPPPPAPAASATPPPREVPPPLAPPPRAAAPVPPAAAPPRPPSVPIDWERWIGIRGAAVLGAVVLGLAGLLFFKYSVERGLLTPPMRVASGILTGIVCLAGSFELRRRDYRPLAEGVAGAGVVILYAAFWAAHVLYGLIGPVVAFGAMILVTAVCALLAVRQGSYVVAVLGLAGGFATPLLLSRGEDRPIGLFGYILLLDVGLLAIGVRQKWPSIAALSLVGTVLLQGLWMGTRMRPEQDLLALVILGLFAMLFVLLPRWLDPAAAPQSGWLASRAGAVIFPFVFAVYLASRSDLGPRLYPIGILMAVLGVGAMWIARDSRERGIGLATSAASVAVVWVWTHGHALTQGTAWEVAIVVFGLAAAYHAFVEAEPAAPGKDGPAPAALVSALGGFAVLLAAAVSGIGLAPWPWIYGFALLAGLVFRHGGFPGRAALHVAAAAGMGLGVTLLHVAHLGEPAFPTAERYLIVLLLAALVGHGIAFLRGEPLARRFAEHAAVALPAVLLFGLFGTRLLPQVEPLAALGATIVLGVLAILAATRSGSGIAYAIAAGGMLVAQASWTGAREALATDASEALVALGLQLATVVLITAWPFVAHSRFAREPAALYAAALAGPLWFMPAKRLFETAFGDAFIAVLPLTFAAIAFGAVVRARGAWAQSDPMRLRALAWFAAVALGFVSIAIPLQLEREWITIGWALEGLAVTALWRRLDHPGLKYFALALLGAVTARLVVNPALFDYYPRSETRIVNWLLYTYAVPAAALLGTARLLGAREVERLRDWERRFYATLAPVGSIAAGVAAVAVIFVWINLAVSDWFTTGTRVSLSFGDTPAQRLTVSIAWALYALVLLGFGIARGQLGLRWISLGLLLVTIAKVFLYDLGALRDLYRVASLVGLAISLLLVSFLYQRFVFRKVGSEHS